MNTLLIVKYNLQMLSRWHVRSTKKCYINCENQFWHHRTHLSRCFASNESQIRPWQPWWTEYSCFECSRLGDVTFALWGAVTEKESWLWISPSVSNVTSTLTTPSASAALLQKSTGGHLSYLYFGLENTRHDNPQQLPVVSFEDLNINIVKV